MAARQNRSGHYQHYPLAITVKITYSLPRDVTPTVQPFS
jgi:hypothetical protein